MFFFQAILHVGAPYKKMRHFCDIGLHPLLDYNDLTQQQNRAIYPKLTRINIVKKENNSKSHAHTTRNSKNQHKKN